MELNTSEELLVQAVAKHPGWVPPQEDVRRKEIANDLIRRKILRGSVVTGLYVVEPER